MNGFNPSGINMDNLKHNGGVRDGNDACEIIIELKDENASLIEIINKYGTIKHFFPMINSYVVELPEKYVKELETNENVAAVFENTRITAQMNDGRRAVRADAAHKNGYDGSGITMAFLDTGISPVKDFTYPKNRILAFKDFIKGIPNPYDDNGHGTHVWSRYSHHKKQMFELKFGTKDTYSKFEQRKRINIHFFRKAN